MRAPTDMQDLSGAVTDVIESAVQVSPGLMALVLAWRAWWPRWRVGSTEPIPGAGSSSPRSIGRICKFAFVDRKASASDALR
jgi:hypothetical protein